MRSLFFLTIIMISITTIARADNVCHTFTSLYQDQELSLCDVDDFSVVAFWSAKCIPCLKEAKMLHAYAKKHPTITIHIVSVDDEQSTKEYFGQSAFRSKTYRGEKIQKNFNVFIANGDQESLFRSLGNSYAILPFTIALNAKGEICKSKNGMLGTQTIDNWKRQCLKHQK